MKTVQIVWHEKEPISSLDFSKSGVLATAGADKTIKVRSICTIFPETPVSNFDLTATPFLPPQTCDTVQFWQVRVLFWGMGHMMGKGCRPVNHHPVPHLTCRWCMIRKECPRSASWPTTAA